jgi:hypothetical protein
MCDTEKTSDYTTCVSSFLMTGMLYLKGEETYQGEQRHCFYN